MAFDLKKIAALNPDLGAGTDGTSGKRYAGRLRSNTLEEDQLSAYNGLREFLFNSGSRFGTLNGAAGTGKTYLLSVLIESILMDQKIHSIAVCAPTHKAVKVLESSCDYYHQRLSFMTIHSLLGVEVVVDNYGKQVFKPTFAGSKVKEYSIIICDEYSMLDDELVSALDEQKAAKVLFVGDLNQIPPVGLDITKVAKPEFIDYFDVKQFSLTKIMRQAEGNPIIDASTKVKNDASHLIKTSILEDGTGVEVVPMDAHNSDYLESLLEDYFTSSYFIENSDFVKVVCWTNKMTNYMNNVIRHKIYGEDASSKIVIGERLIADKPIKEGEQLIFTTNQEFQVNSFEIDELKIGSGDDATILKHYVIDVDYYTDGNRLVRVPIKVLHEDSQEDYDNIIKFLKDRAINHAAYGLNRSKMWKSFYEFQETFAHVKYNYALTAHKSQGSTYNNAIVMLSDINKNRKDSEKKKILYTSVTRAKHKLYLLTN